VIRDILASKDHEEIVTIKELSRLQAKNLVQNTDSARSPVSSVFDCRLIFRDLVYKTFPTLNIVNKCN